MADGRTHTMVAAVAGGIGAGLVFVAAKDLAPWYAGGAIASMVITPDLDKIEPTISAALVGWWRIPWRLFWLPYGLIPHRCWCSHAPIIGTLGRLLYIILAIWGAAFIFYTTVPTPATIALPIGHFTYWVNLWSRLLGLSWALPTRLSIDIPHIVPTRLIFGWIHSHLKQTAVLLAPLFINDTLHTLWDDWKWGWGEDVL